MLQTVPESVITQCQLDRIAARLIHRDGTSCMEWLGSKLRGYGRTSISTPDGRKWKLVHRLVYEACVGPIPDGLCVCHHCDNPSCCNPNHLWVGTVLENLKDMELKGRARGRIVSGSDPRRPKAALTLEKAKEIRLSPLSRKELAAIYGVSQRAIQHVKERTTWNY